MGEIKFVVGLIMVALFAIAIVSYASNFATDNDAVLSIADEEGFDSMSSDLNSSVQTFKTQSGNSSTGFFQTNVEAGDETTRSGGTFKVGISSMIGSIKSILKVIQDTIFGGKGSGFGVVFTAIASLLVYISIRYIWKTWKGGNPD